MSTQQKKSLLGTGLVLLLLLAVLFSLTVKQNKPLLPDPAAPVALPFSDDPAQLQAVGGERSDGEWKFGYTPRPDESAAFVRALPRPTLAQAGPEILEKAREDVPVFLYRARNEAYAHFNGGAQWKSEKQGIGDCVSHGWAGSCDTHLAVMWKNGETSEWKEASTESIYGGSRVEARGVNRGGYSDGSYGAAAGKWVNQWGVTFRQPYDKFDLTKYSARLAKDWGNFGNGGDGDNGQFDNEAKKHPIKGVVLIRNFKEAAAAIQSGHPIAVCSGQGFSSTRDNQGFARPSGRWSHCMRFEGVRFDRPGLLCQNSWGPNWNSGPKFPADQPDGSFWVDAATVDSMLRGNDSFAVSGYEGFKYRKLDHGDWVITEPAEIQEYLVRVNQQQNNVAARREEIANYSIAP